MRSPIAQAPVPSSSPPSRRASSWKLAFGVLVSAIVAGSVLAACIPDPPADDGALAGEDAGRLDAQTGGRDAGTGEPDAAAQDASGDAECEEGADGCAPGEEDGGDDAAVAI